MKRDHFVYLVEDAAGVLLYIGLTINPRQRRASHQSASPWFREMARTRMIGPLPGDAAADLESVLILKLGPRHNKRRCSPRRRGAFADWGDLLMRELERYESPKDWVDRCAEVVARAKSEREAQPAS